VFVVKQKKELLRLDLLVVIPEDLRLGTRLAESILEILDLLPGRQLVLVVLPEEGKAILHTWRSPLVRGRTPRVVVVDLLGLFLRAEFPVESTDKL
jgi:hypothetical protein